MGAEEGGGTVYDADSASQMPAYINGPAAPRRVAQARAFVTMALLNCLVGGSAFCWKFWLY